MGKVTVPKIEWVKDPFTLDYLQKFAVKYSIVKDWPLSRWDKALSLRNQVRNEAISEEIVSGLEICAKEGCPFDMPVLLPSGDGKATAVNGNHRLVMSENLGLKSLAVYMLDAGTDPARVVQLGRALNTKIANIPPPQERMTAAVAAVVRGEMTVSEASGSLKVSATTVGKKVQVFQLCDRLVGLGVANAEQRVCETTLLKIASVCARNDNYLRAATLLLMAYPRDVDTDKALLECLKQQATNESKFLDMVEEERKRRHAEDVERREAGKRPTRVMHGVRTPFLKNFNGAHRLATTSKSLQLNEKELLDVAKKTKEILAVVRRAREDLISHRNGRAGKGQKPAKA